MYRDLNAKIDEFVEVMLGKESRASVLQATTVNVPLIKQPAEFKELVLADKKFLHGLSQVFSSNVDSDLLALRDELLALLNQFLYLLTLY